MGFRGGGGQIDPSPQHILVFKYPSRDRFNVLYHEGVKNGLKFNIKCNTLFQKFQLLKLSYESFQYCFQCSAWSWLRYEIFRKSYFFFKLDSNLEKPQRCKVFWQKWRHTWQNVVCLLFAETFRNIMFIVKQDCILQMLLLKKWATFLFYNYSYA